MSRESNEQSAQAYYNDTFGYQPGNPDDVGYYPGEVVPVRVKRRRLIHDIKDVSMEELLADKPF